LLRGANACHSLVQTVYFIAYPDNRLQNRTKQTVYLEQECITQGMCALCGMP